MSTKDGECGIVLVSLLVFTKYHKHGGFKKKAVSHSSGGHGSDAGLTGPNQGVGKTAFTLEALGENPLTCLFQFLEAATLAHGSLPLFEKPVTLHLTDHSSLSQPPV